MREPRTVEVRAPFDQALLTTLPLDDRARCLERMIEEAIGLYRAARRQGVTVRPSVDCLIAACAIRHDLEVLHRDRDFVQIARVSALRERDL